MTTLTATVRHAVAGGAAPGPVTISRRDGNGVRAVRGPYVYGPGSSTFRRNLAANPSSELAPLPLAYGHGTVVRSSEQAYVGTYSTKITSLGDYAYAYPAASAPATTAARVLTFSAWVRTRATSVRVQAYIGGVEQPKVVRPATPQVWQRVALTVAVPAGATLEVALGHDSELAAGLVIYIDAVMLEEGTSAGTYFDGATGTAGATRAWEGAAHASPSRETTAASTRATVTDWEGALVGAVRYLVIDAAGDQALADVIMPSASLPQWRRTNRPDVAFTLEPGELVLSVASEQALRVSEHEPIGRPDVVFTTYLLGLRRGTLEVLLDSYPRAVALARVYADGKVVRLRQPTHPGVDMHHLGLSVAIAPDGQDKHRWAVSIRYAEVTPPATDALPAWNLELLAAAFTTLADVSLAYADLEALAADDRPTQ